MVNVLIFLTDLLGKLGMRTFPSGPLSGPPSSNISEPTQDVETGAGCKLALHFLSLQTIAGLP